MKENAKMEPFQPTPPTAPVKRGGSDLIPPDAPSGSMALGVELQAIRELLKHCPQEITVNGETTKYTTVDLVQNLLTASEMTSALHVDALERLERCKRLLRDFIASSVLTDGFMTMAVAQSMMNQAEAAKKLLADLEQP